MPSTPILQMGKMKNFYMIHPRSPKGCNSGSLMIHPGSPKGCNSGSLFKPPPLCSPAVMSRKGLSFPVWRMGRLVGYGFLHLLHAIRQ